MTDLDLETLAGDIIFFYNFPRNEIFAIVEHIISINITYSNVGDAGSLI